MVAITIIASTPPCDKCQRTKEIAARVVLRLGGKVEVKILAAGEPEAAKYGVIMTPTVLVDRALIAIGKVPDENKLEQLVRKKLEIGK